MRKTRKERKKVVKKIGKHIAVVVLLLWSTGAVGQDFSVNASASKTSVALEEVFRVTFSVDESGVDLTPPNFDGMIVVGGPYSSQSYQNINGRSSMRISLAYDLMPRELGTFTIGPAVGKKGRAQVESNVLTVEVKERAKRAQEAAATPPFEINMLTERREVFVGEPFILQLQAKYVRGTEGLQIVQSPNFEGVLQKELQEDGERSTERVNGQLLEVYNFQKRLIIPNTPGTLSGTDLIMSAQVPVKTDRFDIFGRPYYTGVQKTAHARVPAVKIKALPSPKPEGFSGGVGALKLVRTVSRTELGGDESLTITLRLEGSGNLNTLSVPELVAPEGFDVYDPKYSEDLSYTSRGLRGYKSNEYLLVPQFKGTFDLPEMKWTFFNSSTAQYETIVLPAEQIKVLSGPELPQSGASGVGGDLTVEKRKVKTLDTDIRYLQEVKPAKKGMDGTTWSLVSALLLAVAWALQAWTPKERHDNDLARWRQLKKQVDQAFAQQSDRRVALLVHALEQRLFERHGRFAISSEELEQRYEKDVAQAIARLYEQCQLAQYAPISNTAQDELYTAFTALWKQL